MGDVRGAFKFKSVILALRSILADKFKVSFPILFLSIVAVSEMFNFVISEESIYFCLAYFKVSEISNFKSNAAFVALLIGLEVSFVFSTLDNPILDLSIANTVFRLAILETPVPPFSTGIIPAMFIASTDLAN